jgi:hypothetical protein
MNDSSTPSARAIDHRFDRLGGWAALAGAAVAVVYALAFVVLKNDLLAAVALMAGGLLSAAALFAAYEHVRAAGPLAALGLALGIFGTIGAAVHGAYDLANVLHPPGTPLTGPNPIDPRGFLTFGVTGLALLKLSWAGMTAAGLPRPLLYLGFVLGVVLLLIYLARLVVLDATSMLVLGPALAGAVLSPIWYGWLGYTLLTHRPASA